MGEIRAGNQNAEVKSTKTLDLMISTILNAGCRMRNEIVDQEKVVKFLQPAKYLWVTGRKWCKLHFIKFSLSTIRIVGCSLQNRKREKYAKNIFSTFHNPHCGMRKEEPKR